MPHEKEDNYVLRLATLNYHGETVKRFMGSETCYLDRPYIRHYLTCHAGTSSKELDFELEHRRGPVFRQLKWKTQRCMSCLKGNQVSFYRTTPDLYSSRKLICSFGVPHLRCLRTVTDCLPTLQRHSRKSWPFCQAEAARCILRCIPSICLC